MDENAENNLINPTDLMIFDDSDGEQLEVPCTFTEMNEMSFSSENTLQSTEMSSENEQKEIDSLLHETKTAIRKGIESTLEIGKNLTRLKEIVKHGNWENWLEENLKFSKRTANRFIQLYKSYWAYPTTLTDLEQSKALILVDFEPKEKREDFIRESFSVKGNMKMVREMVVSELQIVNKKYNEVKREIYWGKRNDMIRDDTFFIEDRYNFEKLCKIEKYKELYGELTEEAAKVIFEDIEEKKKDAFLIELFDEIIEKTNEELLKEASYNMPKLVRPYKRLVNKINNMFPDDSSEEDVIKEVIEALKYYRNAKENENNS